MRIPVITGVIDRRILANWRCDPAILSRLLPAPFRPKQINGFGIAGICLIRLKEIRPRGLPGAMGISSENAAHRIAVEWDEALPDGRTVRREGVFIPRRDSSSRLNTVLGGRLFPGVHHHARFNVNESGDDLRIEVRSDDGATEVSIDARRAVDLPRGSVFPDLNAASAFFEAGSVGFSPGRGEGELDGLELRTHRWNVEPLEVMRATSSFFDDTERFPSGSAVFDCALLMRKIEHEWHGHAAPAQAGVVSATSPAGAAS